MTQLPTKRERRDSRREDVTERARSLKAFRGEYRFTTAAEDIGEASKRWDLLDEAATRLGLHGEGGAVEAMKPADVMPGSPLDKELKAPRPSEEAHASG